MLEFKCLFILNIICNTSWVFGIISFDAAMDQVYVTKLQSPQNGAITPSWFFLLVPLRFCFTTGIVCLLLNRQCEDVGDGHGSAVYQPGAGFAGKPRWRDHA